MILHVARREWLEQSRHPAMLAVCAGLLTGIAALALGTLVLLQLVVADPERVRTIGGVLGSSEAADLFVRGATEGTLMAWNFLVFSQYLGFVGVMAGHGILHDRQSGTLPFLLLAPIGRHELVLGKVFGALGPLTAIYGGLAVLGGLFTLALPITAAWPELGPRGPGWWLALLFAGPTWAGFVATVCAILSSVARDVRLAQQGVWFVVFFVQLLVAFLITGSLGDPFVQVAATAVGVASTGLAVVIGGGVLSRDLGR